MIRTGQCEACEAWYLARHLTRTRVTRPTIAERDRIAERSMGVPGLEAPLYAWFCPGCLAALDEEPAGEETAIIRPGDPEFAMAAAVRQA